MEKEKEDKEEVEEEDEEEKEKEKKKKKKQGKKHEEEEEEEKKKEKETMKKKKKKQPKEGMLNINIGEEDIVIDISSVHEHYKIANKEPLLDYMIYTLHSWINEEVNSSTILASLRSELLSQDLSIQGSFLCASVLLVSAHSKSSIPPLRELLSHHYYCARGLSSTSYHPALPQFLTNCSLCYLSETFIAVYCNNFITTCSVFTSYSPQLSLFFNYNCNIHMHSHSDCQAHSPTASTFYTLIFHETNQQGSIKPAEHPPLMWDYISPSSKYKGRAAPVQRQAYINIHPILTVVINSLPALVEEEPLTPPAKSQLNAPPPIFFTHLLHLFISCDGFVVDFNSTTPWPAIGAFRAAVPYVLSNEPAHDVVCWQSFPAVHVCVLFGFDACAAGGHHHH